ncbi:hypothetical protein EJB05_25117, partial [Eragrostis curvula]
MGDGGLCELLVDERCELRRHVSDAEDLFSILGTWEGCMNGAGGEGGATAAAAFRQNCAGGGSSVAAGAASARLTGNSRRRSVDEAKGGGAPVHKKQKGSSAPALDSVDDDGEAKMSHIAVERNRRKQMNEHLAVLRSLMPCFYVKRGDQASIIGGVVDYIKELQQLLRSLEAKKHRKTYAEQVLSPRPGAPAAASPRPLIRPTPPLSPRVGVPISPRTPTRPGSPYMPCGGAARPPHHPAAAYMASPAMTPTTSSSSSSYHDQQQQQHFPQPYLPTLDSIVTELAAHAGGRPAVPDVRVEFAGPNLVLKTVSRRAPGQALKIIAALESRALEILHVSVSTVDDTMMHSFTIKVLT